MSISCGPLWRKAGLGQHHEHQLWALPLETRASIMSINWGPFHLSPGQGQHHEHQLGALSPESGLKASIMSISCGPLWRKPA